MTTMSEVRRRAMPLSMMPTVAQERIADEVARPTPPPRWRTIDDGRGIGRSLAQIESRGWYEWHWQRGIEPGVGRPAIPTAVRAAVMARDGLVCGICGGIVDQDDVHLDHIIPVARRGSTTIGNLRVTHSTCNMRKGAR